MTESDHNRGLTLKTKLRVLRTYLTHQTTTRPLTILWVAALTFTLFIGPAAAQSCDGPLLTTAQNATTWLTVAGPVVGTANAGYNMMKASGTNKSGNKKEYKENIRSSLMYGFGLGMLTGIVNLITQWGPMSTC